MSKYFEIKINKGALERVLREAGNKAVKEQAPHLQRMFDSLHRSHAGKPLTQVKPALQTGFFGSPQVQGEVRRRSSIG